MGVLTWMASASGSEKLSGGVTTLAFNPAVSGTRRITGLRPAFAPAVPGARTGALHAVNDGGALRSRSGQYRPASMAVSAPRASPPCASLAATAEPSTEVVQAGSALVGNKSVVVITGASSGPGLSATKALCAKGYFVIAAVRDPSKMDAVAKASGLEKKSYFAMKLELASLQSVKDFVGNLHLLLADRPINHLICNGAIYLPKDCIGLECVLAAIV